MSRIQIVSASAGSGKTYRLSTLLEEKVCSGEVRPEAVIATTFTNKAAAELQERVRARLLKAGRADDAARLGAARMGTVNSVCGRLLGDFAFELGLRPELAVLDSALAEVSLARALSAVVQPDELDRLAELEQRMPEFSWRSSVQRILELARSNGISPTRLAESADRSVGEVLALLGPEEQGVDFDGALAGALETFVSEVEAGADGTKATAAALATALDALTGIHRGRQLPWSDWVKLAGLSTGAGSREVAVPVREMAAGHDRHPRLRGDLVDAIRIVFSLAARALDAYADHKKDWGSIDFVDQEVLALRLLQDLSIRERLQGEIDLVLVDEFQDTSPLQLAIFLELSSLAKQSVWVGDQKQSIYGFRGTDPALMDAAIAAILEGDEPETLARSYRSRPELVKVTSDLFVGPFSRHGIPPSRVRLEPSSEHEAADLGAVAERWNLMGKNQGLRHAEVANMVRQLLADPEARVRDRINDSSRAIRPGDVAVLCRKNDTCTELAGELSALGIRVVLPRPGLLATQEGQAALAALRLWVDPGDSLAMAQLAQITVWAGRPEEWLAEVVSAPGAAAFAELPLLLHIRERRQQMQTAGVVDAFDAAIDAADLRELCLRWGDAEARQANLDALRAHVCEFGERMAAQGFGATVSGLISELDKLAAAGEDAQAVLASDDAVVLSTWHGAKGLEWPVAVLYELDGMGEDRGLGVRVVSDTDFDLEIPLAGRWIRFWPNPYHRSQTKAPFHQRLAEHPALEAIREQDERQNLRLLYVGWTRARDRLVLASPAGKLSGGLPSLLSDEAGSSLLLEPQGNDATWAGRTIGVTVREAAGDGVEIAPAEPGEGYLASGPGSHVAAFAAPSSFQGRGAVGEPISIGKRAPLSGSPDMNHLGEAIHSYLGATTAGGADRIDIAANALRRWGVPDALQPAAVVQMGESLERWIQETWPDAIIRREWPVLHRRGDGSVVRGTIDLLLETEQGLVVIDHKSFPGDRDDAVERAATYAGQLSAYSEAIAAATGRPVVGTFIHLAISGWVVPVVSSPAA